MIAVVAVTTSWLFFFGILIGVLFLIIPRELDLIQELDLPRVYENSFSPVLPLSNGPTIETVILRVAMHHTGVSKLFKKRF